MRIAAELSFTHWKTEHKLTLIVILQVELNGFSIHSYLVTHKLYCMQKTYIVTGVAVY